jgi:CBS domain-containing protein
MSPRAASRLRTLGFDQAYDYAGGKEDWLAFGLPRDGALADVPLAGDRVRDDVPTCGPGDSLDEVRRRVEQSDWDTCLVLDGERVVLGQVGRGALRESSAATAEEAMNEGPSTVRPSEPLEALRERMLAHELTVVPVTTPEGRLVGVLRLDDLERAS